MGIKISDKDRELLKEGKLTIEELFVQSQKELKEQLQAQKEIDKLDAEIEQVGSDFISAKHEHLSSRDNYYKAIQQKRELKRRMIELRKRRAKLKHNQKIR